MQLRYKDLIEMDKCSGGFPYRARHLNSPRVWVSNPAPAVSDDARGSLAEKL